MNDQDDKRHEKRGVSRRSFLAGLTFTAGGAAMHGASGAAYAATGKTESGAPGGDPLLEHQTIPFDGEHQSGIELPAAGQTSAHVMGFNLRAGKDKTDLIRLLRVWTEDSRRITQGSNPLGSLEPELAVNSANLTITCGFGEPLFAKVGLESEKPEWLHPIPAMKLDQLDPQWGQTDLVLQVAADDPVTSAFAARHLQRAGNSYAELVWDQVGFNGAHYTKPAGTTGRNLFGQIDGTVNPHSPQDYNDQVWITDGPEWTRGGTAMVVRRIFMFLDTWEILDRPSREIVTGRTLDTGAPLSGGEEFTPADFKKIDETGLPVIDPRSHMAAAHPPADQPGQKLLRRPWNFNLGPDPQYTKKLEREGVPILTNAGLIFVCYQKNPDLQFTPIQQRLDKGDRLNQWIAHIGSAVYAVPRGVGEGRDHYWGEGLLG